MAALPPRKTSRRSAAQIPASLHVVVGGGIAGVSCAQELAANGQQVLLLSASNILKESSSVMKISKHLEELAVYEKKTDCFQLENPGITVKHGVLKAIDVTKKIIYTDDEQISYSELCLCTGATPKLVTTHPNVIGIRDLESVTELVKRFQLGKKVIVLGNGGIALELLHVLGFCDVEWIVKDKYIGSAFFDASASAFIMPTLLQRAGMSNQETFSISASKELSPVEDTNKGSEYKIAGTGLGPEWLVKSKLIEQLPADVTKQIGKLNVHFQQEIVAYTDTQKRWIRLDSGHVEVQPLDPLVFTAEIYVLTSSGDVIGGDFVISATGVVPNVSLYNGDVQDKRILVDHEGAIIVDDYMRSNIPNIFAAGDCCSCRRSDTGITNWYQMRLWTQARSMGIYSAHCMLGIADSMASDFFFELFAHVTRFFGYKVVLLGRYNAQGLGNIVENAIKEMVVAPDGLIKRECGSVVAQGGAITSATYDVECDSCSSSTEIWTRISPKMEYVKLVISHGKIVGALLIGNTDLEETFENLILNCLDVSAIGIELLNPDVDIEDYFD